MALFSRSTSSGLRLEYNSRMAHASRMLCAPLSASFLMQTALVTVELPVTVSVAHPQVNQAGTVTSLPTISAGCLDSCLCNGALPLPQRNDLQPFPRVEAMGRPQPC